MQRSLGGSSHNVWKLLSLRSWVQCKETAVVQDIACFPSCLWGDFELYHNNSLLHKKTMIRNCQIGVFFLSIVDNTVKWPIEVSVSLFRLRKIPKSIEGFYRIFKVSQIGLRNQHLVASIAGQTLRSESAQLFLFQKHTIQTFSDSLAFNCC